MKRIDRVLREVKTLSKTTSKESIISGKDIGFSAIDIADRMKAQRNNISSDLNNLYKDCKLIKISGKPTLFFDRYSFEKKFNISLGDKPVCVSTLTELIKDRNIDANKNKVNNSKKLFNKLIGCNGSLALIVKQAKAAVLYPPFGLNTLILGETGVGKSMLAELMYEYGKEEKVFNDDAPFIAFNCADYANNPQLLISQLFGYVKGAFTGADKDKEGIVEQCDGGMLFLDEIHRLPPEGQEMLFTLIDNGMFRRIGEAYGNRNVKVMIVGATTENISSSLLNTFIRRMPMVIRMPALSDREPKERLELIENFYKSEAKRLGQTITVEREVIVSLMCYKPNGNVGQLRSDIQLSSAGAFLEYKIYGRDKIFVSSNYLPEYVKDSLFNADRVKKGIIEKIITEKYYKFDIVNSNIDFQEPKYDFEKYFYKLLEEKSSSDITLQKAFKDYSQIVLKDLYLNNSQYPDFIDDETIEVVNLISDIVYKELNIVINKNIYYSLAFHYKNLIQNYSHSTDYVALPNMDYIKIKYPELYKTSINIIKNLKKELQIYCPPFEPFFLTAILNTIKNNNTESRVGIIILAHGESTASNIASVTNELLGINSVKAIDMPLSIKPEEIIGNVIKLVKEIDQGKGVLLLVDMGSLTNLGKLIREKTGIDIMVVDNVTILMAIEAARKSMLPNVNLEQIVYSIIKMNQEMYEKTKRRINEDYNKKVTRIIFTVCTSGQGTAFYLEKNIKDILYENNIFDIKVIPLSFANKIQFKEIISETSKDKYIIAIVGSIDPNFTNIPFISVEDIILNNGLKKLLNLIDPNLDICNDEQYINKINTDIIWRTATEATDKYLQFISSEKILPLIKDMIFKIEKQLNLILTKDIIVKLFIHISCMIERLTFNENKLSSNIDIDLYKRENHVLWDTVSGAFNEIEKAFGLEIPDNEIYYIVEIFKENKTNCIVNLD